MHDVGARVMAGLDGWVLARGPTWLTAHFVEMLAVCEHNQGRASLLWLLSVTSFIPHRHPISSMKFFSQR